MQFLSVRERPAVRALRSGRQAHGGGGGGAVLTHDPRDLAVALRRRRSGSAGAADGPVGARGPDVRQRRVAVRTSGRPDRRARRRPWRRRAGSRRPSQPAPRPPPPCTRASAVTARRDTCGRARAARRLSACRCRRRSGRGGPRVLAGVPQRGGGCGRGARARARCRARRSISPGWVLRHRRGVVGRVLRRWILPSSITSLVDVSDARRSRHWKCGGSGLRQRVQSTRQNDGRRRGESVTLSAIWWCVMRVLRDPVSAGRSPETVSHSQEARTLPPPLDDSRRHQRRFRAARAPWTPIEPRLTDGVPG